MLRKSPPTHTTRPRSVATRRRSRPETADFSARRCEVLHCPVLLIVSDDSLLRWALYEALAAAHFRILACRDEAHTRQILPKIEVDLSLAIVDDDTWPMTADAREFLRQRWPHLPILVLAHPGEGLEERVAELDLAGVLTKPFDVAALVGTVTDILLAQVRRERHASSPAVS
jgi:DNA-binding response OmpR family regulator